MALTYGEIDAHVREKYIPVLQDQVYYSFPMFVKLAEKAKIVYDSGSKIRQPVLYDDLAGGSYTGLDTFDIGTKEITSLAEWDWKQYYVNVTVDGTTQLKVEGDEKVLSVLEAKIEVAAKTMRKNLVQDMFQVTPGAKDVDGLIPAIATTGTYAGIDKAANTWWQGNVRVLGGSLTLAELQTAYGNCCDGPVQPDIIITTQLLYDKLWSLLQANQMYNKAEGAHAGLTAAGFSYLEFNNAAVVVDKYCPAGYVFMVNTDFWKLVVHKRRDMSWTEAKTPIDQDAFVRQILWAGNLACTAPRWNGLISGATA